MHLPNAPLDGIVANLQSHLLIPLFSTFEASLLPGGWLVVSGILGGEREGILFAARAEGFHFVEDDEEDGWWTGAFMLSQPPR
jgi:ribosomal protein L11 methylase PrmA